MGVPIAFKLPYTERVVHELTHNRQTKGSGPAKVLRLVNHPAKVLPLLGARW